MTESAKPRRVWRFVLVASLVLNLLLIGLIAGAVGSGRAGPQRGFDVGLGSLGQILPREERGKIGRDIRRSLRNAGHSPRDLAIAMREVVAILEAETFDAEAFVAAIQSQQAWQAQVRDAALESFVTHVGAMSVDERRTIADALRDRMRRGPQDRKGQGTEQRQ